MRAFVTGVAGFAGRHLARHLLEEGDSVGGLVHALADAGGDDMPSGVQLFEADLLDGAAVGEALVAAEPEVVFHLAAFSNPERSWEESRRTLETNFLGAHNLLQASLSLPARPGVLLVGSAQQYGAVAEHEQPIGEDQPLRPHSPYGVSKAAQELLGLSYYFSEKLPVYLVRSFNHTGPGQAPSYVCSSFARQIAEIEVGRRKPSLQVGNLAARRDFTDVRDVVRAYRAVVEKGRPAETYNVCRGEAYSIRQILDALLDLAATRIEIAVDQTLFHSLDVSLVLGDNSKARYELGWEPRWGLRQTLADLLDYWRARVNGVSGERGAGT
jgi:GDP-4-dehydro-6-deoxy-D-mannose reductase